MSTDIKELKKQRFLYLKKLYEITEGNETRYVNFREIGEQLGFNKDQSYKISEYLKGEYLLDFVTIGGGIKITHQGIVEIEKALEEPNEPTEHFLPVNIINIGSMENSQIQQGTINSTQIQTIDLNKIPEIKAILEKFTISIENLRLGSNDKNDLESEIQTVEAQLKSSTPKKQIIVECFKSMKNILENAVPSVLAKELSDSLSNITF